MKKSILFLFLAYLLLFLSCSFDLKLNSDAKVSEAKVEVTVGPNVTANNLLFSVIHGGTVTVVATADKDYVIDIVQVDGVPITIPSNLTVFSYTFSMIYIDHRISITSKKSTKS